MLIGVVMVERPTGAEKTHRNIKLLHRGDGPLVLAMPHVGTELSSDDETRLNTNGLQLTDTDWHVDRLFEGLLPSASMLQMNVHRYTIDANRDPEGKTLYPGQATTDLVPVTDFDGVPIWQDGKAPTDDEIRRRTQANHRPYHMALQLLLRGAKERHGCAILFDCHSIRSVVPRLFEGTLPDLNIGDNVHTTCDRRVHDTVRECADASAYSVVSNGRFKGGWTTRHYGRPLEQVHAIQLEIAQSTYLAQEAAPWTFDAAKAERLRSVLADMLNSLDELARSGELIA